MQRWAEAAKAGFSRVADIVLPPLCLGCGCGLDSHAALCGTCWAGVDFIDRPYCEVTGVPFPYEAGLGAVSAAAIANPPSYARARAVMRYNEGSTRLIHRFKYSDRMEAAPAFALWLVRAGAALLAEADLVVPVPLHKRRLFFPPLQSVGGTFPRRCASCRYRMRAGASCPGAGDPPSGRPFGRCKAAECCRCFSSRTGRGASRQGSPDRSDR